MVLCLQLSILILIIGFGLVGRTVLQYRGAAETARAVQAQEAAVDGLMDAYVKLCKDYNFPPGDTENHLLLSFNKEQLVFTYGETLPGAAFTVTVDRTFVPQPYQIIRLVSVGTSDPTRLPLASHRVYAEVDVAQYDRVIGSTTPNPNYFHLMNRQDQ